MNHGDVKIKQIVDTPQGRGEVKHIAPCAHVVLIDGGNAWFSPEELTFVANSSAELASKAKKEGPKKLVEAFEEAAGALLTPTIKKEIKPERK